MRQAARDLQNGVALAWALPGDRTCAGVARSVSGDLLGALGVPIAAIRDAQTMVSEAATNAFEHARFPHETRGPCELWAHRSGTGIVGGVFDPAPERPLPPCPGGAQRDPLAEHGRGLSIIAAYSDGRWGAHLTRGRLGGHVPGKVVWFRTPAEVALPVLALDPAPGDMARMLGVRLHARGVRGLVLAACPRMAVLSVCRGLDVWCSQGRFQLREPAPGSGAAWPAGEVATVVEHAVRRYEEGRLAVRTCPDLDASRRCR